VGTHGLDGIQVQLRVKEHVYDEVATFRVVEEHKQAPVYEPGALLKGEQGAAERLERQTSTYNVHVYES